jgi:hypothetical protein
MINNNPLKPGFITSVVSAGYSSNFHVLQYTFNLSAKKPRLSKMLQYTAVMREMQLLISSTIPRSLTLT